jgi:hypothetical protein
MYRLYIIQSRRSFLLRPVVTSTLSRFSISGLSTKSLTSTFYLLLSIYYLLLFFHFLMLKTMKQTIFQKHLFNILIRKLSRFTLQIIFRPLFIVFMKVSISSPSQTKTVESQFRKTSHTSSCSNKKFTSMIIQLITSTKTPAVANILFLNFIYEQTVQTIYARQVYLNIV